MGRVPENETAPPSSLWMTLAWAGYLGASWTWVIGMFFPALLLRDHGILGFLAFAIPNVLGAAAMAWWVANREASIHIVGVHRRAALGFSDVTIMFHAFGLTCLVSPLLGWPGVVAAVVIALLVWAINARYLRVTALLGLISVLVSAAVVYRFMEAVKPAEPLDLSISPQATADLIWLVPVLAGGFLLCPYLDMTFHRARQNTTAATGRLAFSLGFAGVFMGMILLSLWYAPQIIGLFGEGLPADRSQAIWLWLGIHFVLQTGYTVGLHLHEITTHRGGHGVFRVIVFSIVAAAGGLWVYGAPEAEAGARIETGYRFFLLAYGLLFPAYVVICMIPNRRGVELRVAWRACLVTVLLAGPMAYLGFVGGSNPWWCLGALGMIGLGRMGLTWMPKTLVPIYLSEAVSRERDN